MHSPQLKFSVVPASKIVFFIVVFFSAITQVSVEKIWLSVILFFLSVVYFLLIRAEWATLWLEADVLHYQYRLKRHARLTVPRSSVLRIEIKRWTTPFKLYGSVDEVLLIISGKSQEMSLSLGNPYWMGYRNLLKAGRLASAWNLPILDPIGLELLSKKFFWNQWKRRGEDYKLLLVMLGISLALIAVDLFFR